MRNVILLQGFIIIAPLCKLSRFLAEFDETLCALYMMDLDDFKLVNDALGTYAGDDLLCDTAVVLESVVNTYGGFSGRLGGDEFSMFIPDVVDEDTAYMVAKTLNKGIRAIKCKAEHSASIGIAVDTISKSLKFDSLYYKADQALYYSKRQGKDRCMLFCEKMDEAKPVLNSKFSSYSDEEDYLLDDISDVVYVTEMNSYKLQYMNKAAKLGVGLDDLLKDHPVNLARKKAGKRPANSIWLWGEGKKTCSFTV